MNKRDSLSNKNLKLNQNRKVQDKQNIIRSQIVLNKSKKKQIPQSNPRNTNQTISNQTQRIRGISNKLLHNNISPKKNILKQVNQKNYQYQIFSKQDQNVSASNENFCQNHKNKIAKYQIISDEDTLNYCQKCSIFLASQGFSVSKIEIPVALGLITQSSNPINDGNIEELQIHINFVFKQLQQKQRSVKYQIQDIEMHKKQIENNLQIYFTQIVNTVLEKKIQFFKFVQSQHLKAVQKYKKQQIQLQKAILQTLSIQKQIQSGIQQSEIIYFKNQIKRYRIFCQKIGVSQVQKSDIITVDLSQILELINQKFCIKVRTSDDDNHFLVKNSSDQQEQTASRGDKLKSMSESGIARINDKFSLFQSQHHFD